ncbi:MAG: hypothetical protein IKJ55_00220 [Clostridia bacterium]|nr:hypothetical protein [Clostridia bacterium]
MKKAIVIILCVAIVGVGVFYGFKKIFPEQYEKLTAEIAEKKEQEEIKNYKESFLLSWGMSIEDVDKLIVEDWDGKFHADQEMISGECITRVYTATKLGDLENKNVKMFLEFDDEGLYFVHLYFEEGDNTEAVDLAEKGLEVVLSDTKDKNGDVQKSVLTTEGTAVIYNDVKQVIFYNAYSQNNTTRENNTLYNIL